MGFVQYRALFSRLERFGIIYVAENERMFAKAERIFTRLCGNGVEAVRVARGTDIGRLREHFRQVICLTDARQVRLVRAV